MARIYGVHKEDRGLLSTNPLPSNPDNKHFQAVCWIITPQTKDYSY